MLSFVRSSKFFWLVVALLTLQAGWIALSGQYPMAFDEEYHLGIIQIYADQWGPFIASQPDNADHLRAVFREPSYLYHYLMSFPFRLTEHLTSSQTVQVLILRGINIGLFAGGLVLFRRLLQKTGLSAIIINLSLLIVVLLPVTPWLAAQINYDNLFIPLTALSLLLAVNFSSNLARSKKVDTRLLILTLTICLLTTLVKYAFLPIFAAIAVFLLLKIWHCRRKRWQGLNLRTGIVLGLALLIASGLFFERFGLNTVHYGSPVPDCAKVLSIEQCSKSSVWIRDYKLKKQNSNPPSNPLSYANEWFYGMWMRSFFAVAGPEINYQTRGPLTVPGVSAIFFAVLAAGALILNFPKLLRRYDSSIIWLLVGAALIYIAVLWFSGYMSYVSTGKPVAINGRYLLPVIPLLIPLAAASVNTLLVRWRNIRLAAAVVPIICLLWGGGALTYILRSGDDWNWQTPIVRSANHAVRSVIGPITPGYDRPTQFLR